MALPTRRPREDAGHRSAANHVNAAPDVGALRGPVPNRSAESRHIIDGVVGRIARRPARIGDRQSLRWLTRSAVVLAQVQAVTRRAFAQRRINPTRVLRMLV